MRGYFAFLRKELAEAVAGRRLAVMAALFCGLGMASPFLTRYMSEILAALGSGVTASAPRTAVDAWGAFFNNASGLGLSITLILWAGVVSQEVSRGTLLLMVTRGLPRPAVVMAKWTSAVACFTVCWWSVASLPPSISGCCGRGRQCPALLPPPARAAWRQATRTGRRREASSPPP
ncbi:ABC transporter permease [Collinsella tanakaei]|uniref:ABC transporter permease n=1 Tax=Collinsella tanakaei TaxID=626935 RepID=UPI00195AEB9B|nr:ABC transporter permease [Collinsella tanakaei]MBM6756979.1 ABC transporter permease [Collinsella tanakaei]